MADQTNAMSSRIANRHMLQKLGQQIEADFKSKVEAGQRKDFDETIVTSVFQEVCECHGCKCHNGDCKKKLEWKDRSNWGHPNGWQADHKDENPLNNAKENCQILCSECHIKKTFPNA